MEDARCFRWSKIIPGTGRANCIGLNVTVLGRKTISRLCREGYELGRIVVVRFEESGGRNLGAGRTRVSSG